MGDKALTYADRGLVLAVWKIQRPIKPVDVRAERGVPTATMLYELVGIARVPATRHNSEAANVVRHVGNLILNNRGVIRTVDNWGVRYLPRIMNKNRETHILGSHFYVKFDASPSVQREVLRALRQDARMLRSTIVKVGGSDLPSLLEKREQF